MIEQRVCNLFPPMQARALRNAAQWPRDQRIDEIDRITDQLVAAGFCRRRSSDDLMPRWARIRQQGWGS